MTAVALSPVQPESADPRLVPAPLPMRPDRTTTKVLLNPDTGIFHCADCTKTGPTFSSLMGHRRQHTADRPAKAATTKTGGDVGAQLTHIARLLEEVAAGHAKALETKVDASWRRRALDAERRLTSMRRALGTND